MSIGMPAKERYCLFETALGPFGIAWSERGLSRLQLPEADRVATEQRLGASASPCAPPPWAEQVIAAIGRHLAGQRVEFASVTVDLTDVGEFRRAVYEAARAVGWGETASYGEIARRIGFPWGARAVGQALARNPVPLVVPCHRILTQDGRIGGFSAYGGTVTKQRLLALEGVRTPVQTGVHTALLSLASAYASASHSVDSCAAAGLRHPPPPPAERGPAESTGSTPWRRRSGSRAGG
jgi:methylated-DNA-[protein]-cysteine S-methyltransferase